MKTTTSKMAKAILLAQEIGAADSSGETSRRTHDNISRCRRLDLGIFLLVDNDRETLGDAILAQGLLTAAELSDILKVTEFNVSTDQWDYLYGLSMSFTVNRTLAGVRVRRRKNTDPATTEQRLAALTDTIARNGQVVEDKKFRDALFILPPPNSVANIIELARGNEEYAAELRQQGVYVFKESERGDYTPLDRGQVDPWVERIVDMGASVTSFYDHVEADLDAPVGIIDEARRWADKLYGAADLVAFRHAEDNESQESHK